MAKKQNKERAIEIGLDEEDKRALWRTVLVGSVILGVVLTVIYLVLSKVLSNHPGWLNAARTGLSLLAFWIVITSTIRTYDKIREGVAFFWLVIIGVASATLGILLFLLSLRVWNELGDYGASLPGYNIIGFYAAAGGVASLISLIHLRVKNEKNGNRLEMLVIALAALLFFWITK